METQKKPSDDVPMQGPHKTVFLFGPTAVGKTAAIEALGRELPGLEIISADSVQIYRGQNIGSAKANENEQKAIPHHNIDVRTPDQAYSVADFVRIADTAIDDIRSRGGIPMVSGGTAFYFKHLWFGLPASPTANPAVAAALEGELAERGLPSLRAELAEADPVSHGRIGENDRYRILRALEVFRSSGRPLSSYDLPDEPRPEMDVLAIGLNRDREELYARINARVELMFASGLEGELHTLMAAGYGPGDPGMKAIGYREFFRPGLRDELLERGVLEEDTRRELIAEIQQASRRYAKRQLTFFRSLPGVNWVNADDIPSISSLISGFLP